MWVFMAQNNLIFNYKNNLNTMKKYRCEVCNWIYDEAAGYPEGGIAPGTPFEELPEDFECPLCSVGKEDFVEEA